MIGHATGVTGEVTDEARPLARHERAIFLVLLAANLVPIWAFRYFPGQDTPNHLYTVEVARSLLTGAAEPALSRTFELVLGVKSNVLFHALMLGLGRLGVSLEVAHRLVLSGYALALPLAGLACLRAAGGETALALLLLPLVWSWFALQGLYNYVLSLPPALVWLAVIARYGGRPSWRAAGALALAAVLVYLAHAGTFVAMLFVTAVRVLLPDDGIWLPSRRRLAGARRLALALAPALGIAGVAFLRAAAALPTPPEATVSSWETYGLLEAAGAFVVELAMRFHVSDLLWLAPPAGALIALPLLSVRRRAAGFASRWPLWAAAGLTGLYFVLPHIVWGSDASPRLRPLVLFCLAAYAGVRLSRRARRRVAALALVCGLGGTVALAADCARFGRELDDFVSGSARVPPGSRLYPLVFEPRGDSLLVRPLLHAWGYYGISRHVVTPFAFAWHATRFPLRYRELPLHVPGSLLPSDGEDAPYALEQGRLCSAVRRFAASLSCAEVRRDAEARWASLGQAYDVVLTWSAPADFSALLAARGYRLLHAQGRLALYEPPPGGLPGAPP
jgi:hypothetical protein